MPVLSAQTFRKAAIAALSGAVIAGMAGFAANVGSITFASQAQAADFNQDQCKMIAAVALTVVRRVGKDNLSLEFRQSFRDYLGANITCDGPKEIATPWDKDVAAFNVVREMLLSAPHPISLQKAGLRSVEKVASRDQKRLDAGNPQPGG